MFGRMSRAMKSFSVEIGGVKLHAAADEHGVHIGQGSATAPIADRARLRGFVGTLGDGSELPIYVEEGEREHEYIVYLRGEAVRLSLVTHRDERLRALRKNTAIAGSSAQIITAPMPGLLKAILVEEGAVVEKGEALCILEAMKMENELKSPDRLVVKRLIAHAGNAVDKGAPLVELRPVEVEAAVAAPAEASAAASAAGEGSRS
jgi:biotin carboxyl carrier protein